MPKCDCGAKYTGFGNFHHEKCKALTSVTQSTLDLYATLRFRRVDDNRIDIIDKETSRRVGYFDYSFSRGELSLGCFNADPFGDQMRSGLLRCIDWFIESVNDDRICEWRRIISQERKKWKSDQTPTPGSYL